MPEIVDLTGLNAQDGVKKLLDSFDRLAVDAQCEVVTAEPLQPLVQGLQEQHWGCFDWFPLEIGPPQWRAVLHRMSGKAIPRRLREFMSYDHRRCDELYAQMENAAQSGDSQGAQTLYKAFELGMLHHFTMEENGFFPAFEQRTGMRQGPTMVMRMEHEQMRGILRQMQQAAEQGDMKSLVRAGSTLLMVIQQHNVKEEQMLYAMADMHFGADAEPLLKSMQVM